MEIKNGLPGIKKNVLLKNYTSFRIGGRAKYFFVAKNKKELIRAIKAAKKFKLPYYLLANGTNLLVSDKGFKGIIIQIRNSKFEIRNSKVVAEAGTSLGQLVGAAASKGLTGLEWAAGIPGTVGGAVYGNAGSFGKAMKDITQTVTVLEIPKSTTAHFQWAGSPSPYSRAAAKFQIKKYKNKECRFGYRESVFKKKKNLIILEVELKLKKGKKKEIKQRIKENLNYKKETQPLDFPSAGSVFKNPKDFSAGELIEKCGLKGKRVGNAKISEKHANFIVNLGNARAKDVKKLINLAKQRVKSKFKINLEEEIELL